MNHVERNDSGAAPRRRRRAEDGLEVDGEGSWAISYGDMITLLLTFFILFFTTDPKKDRAHAMETALLASLSPARAPASDTAQKPRLDVGREPGSQIDRDLASEWGAVAHPIGGRLIVEFPSTSFFDNGKIRLREEGKAKLAAFAGKYMPFAGNYQLGIRAYTDTRAVIALPGRRFEDNLELSALRSVAAMRVLQKAGIPLTRMKIGGYGELRATSRELVEARAAGQSGPTTALALARKVVLVIEPAIEPDAGAAPAPKKEEI